MLYANLKCRGYPASGLSFFAKEKKRLIPEQK